VSTKTDEAVAFVADLLRTEGKRPDAAQEIEGWTEEEWKRLESRAGGCCREAVVDMMDYGCRDWRELVRHMFIWDNTEQEFDYWDDLVNDTKWQDSEIPVR
jgi:hypothetical protein